MKLKKLKTKNYKVLQNFEIDFTDKEDNPLDAIVIAGVNGSGKSTLLELIERSLSKDFKFNNRDDFIEFIDKDPDKLIYLRVFDNQKELVTSQIKDFLDYIREKNEDLTIRESNQNW